MELSLLSGVKMQIHSENVRSAAFVGFRSTSSIHLPFGCKSKPTLKPSPLSCCHTEMYFLCFSHSWSTLRSLICKFAFELKQVTWEVSCLQQFIGQSWLLKLWRWKKRVQAVAALPASLAVSCQYIVTVDARPDQLFQDSLHSIWVSYLWHTATE